MDPNANLAEQRKILAAEYWDEEARTAAHERLADLAEALDYWLSNGGALPDAWRRER